MPIGLQPNSPYTLFLIFILLLLSVEPHAEARLAFLKTLLVNTQQTVRIFQSGWQEWQAKMAQYIQTSGTW